MIITVMYNVLQHYFDEPLQSWELELVADVTASWKQQRLRGHFRCFKNPLKKVVLKEKTIAECLVVCAYVTTLKQEVKQRLIAWKRLFVCFLKQLRGHFQVVSCCLTSFVSVNTWEDSVYCVFRWTVKALKITLSLSVVFRQRWRQQWSCVLRTPPFILMMLSNIVCDHEYTYCKT